MTGGDFHVHLFDIKKKSPIDDVLSLPPARREAAVAEFDREFIADTFKPLSSVQRRLWIQAKRKRGRPRVGEGAERVSVTIERTLLKAADREARRLGVSRAKLIALGLHAVIPRPRKRAA